MFLEGTFHIFLVYLLIFIAVISFPLIFKTQWKELLNYFNKIELSQRRSKLLNLFLLCSSLGLIGGSILVISLFNENLFHILPDGETSFNLYASFAFLLLPIGFGLICAYGLLRNSIIKLGHFFLCLCCFLCMGFAGANFHDFLWCGLATKWYSVPLEAGYDLDLWINLFQSPTRDYRVFGFYMEIQVIIFCAYIILNLWRYFQGLPRHSNFLKIKLVLFGALLVSVLGLCLLIIDYPWNFGPILTALTVFLFIPLLSLLSWYIGKNIQILRKNF